MEVDEPIKCTHLYLTNKFISCYLPSLFSKITNIINCLQSTDVESSNPLVFVGKGVTFDSGGISIKPSQAMDEMRADMGGAATVTAALLAAAKLNMKVNVVGT